MISVDPMAKYLHSVSIPFTGFILATVELDTEEPSPGEILDAFYESPEHARMARLSFLDGEDKRMSWPEIADWSFHEHVARGNVCYASLCSCAIDYTESLDGADD